MATYTIDNRRPICNNAVPRGKRQIRSRGHCLESFMYLLWTARGEQFAAVAPCAAAAGPTLLPLLKPKPVLHLAGENDPLVKFEWQKTTIDALRKLNQCGEGKPWEKQCTIYESKTGTPVIAYIHPGGHNLSPEAPAVITKFFKEH